MMHSAVASSCLQMVRHGLGLSNVTGSARHRALRALTTIIRCLPPTGSLDYKYNDPEYRRIRTQVVDALDVFRRFLFTSLARSCTWEVNNVLVTLREHGTKAGVLSEELRQAMATYMDECRSCMSGGRAKSGFKNSSATSTTSGRCASLNVSRSCGLSLIFRAEFHYSLPYARLRILCLRPPMLRCMTTRSAFFQLTSIVMRTCRWS